MLPFSSLLLREYHRAIGWNENNSYSQLTRSSTALLDFQIPQSLILQLANSPLPTFFNSYSLDALPQLNGTVSYITTSEELEGIGPSRDIPFRDVVERFRVYPPPKRPTPKDEVWLGGRRVEGRDYLVYSRLHFPSLHLSGLFTTRLTPTLQAHLAFLSQPAPPTPRATSLPSASPSQYTSSRPSSDSTSSPNPSAAQLAPSNMLFSLQHDIGRFSGEYTYSLTDGMFGGRGLYNFDWSDVMKKGDGDGSGERAAADEVADGESRGRLSAGGEAYFSAKENSFGVSTGLRFTTISPSSPSSTSTTPNPPTTLTILYNPLIGFASSAYSAQISPTIAVSSRFGVNVYSYESDLSIGGEWWIGRRRGKKALEPTTTAVTDERRREREVRLKGLSLRNEEGFERSPVAVPVAARLAPARKAVDPIETGEERDGVLKARISGNWNLALLYEARIRNCLVSLGFTAELLSRNRPIRGVGLEIQYFS